MPRYKATVDGVIQFTPEEEAEWDAMEAAYVPPTEPSAPTKEQLMAQLAALSAQIQSLG